MIFQPRHQQIEARVVVFRPFHQAAAAQQDQQLHEQQFTAGARMGFSIFFRIFHLPHQLTHLLQRRLIHPPVRRIVPVLLLRQQLIQPGEKLERIW
ncbi:hypothetical protein D3C71_1683870 [compost metagenome]